MYMDRTPLITSGSNSLDAGERKARDVTLLSVVREGLTTHEVSVVVQVLYISYLTPTLSLQLCSRGSAHTFLMISPTVS
jgi:hypothetical protein